MTTEELLWNQHFEQEVEVDDSYDYKEEFAMDRYYDNKLFEKFGDYFKPKKSI